MNITYDTNSSMESTHLQEGGVWVCEACEVSPPFFHENNATMITTYETPLATTVQSEAGVQSEAPPVTSKPYWPSEDPVDTSPIPWRWTNRHDMPLEARGRCFFHSIPTTHHPTPTCLLYERDVVDNGTMTCLRSFDYSPSFFSTSTRHCVYGNATMRAVVNVQDAYQLETCGVMVTRIVPLIVMIYLLIAWAWPIFHMIEMRKEENPLRYAIRKLSIWVPCRLACLPFLIFVSNWLEYRFC